VTSYKIEKIIDELNSVQYFFTSIEMIASNSNKLNEVFKQSIRDASNIHRASSILNEIATKIKKIKSRIFFYEMELLEDILEKVTLESFIHKSNDASQLKNELDDFSKKYEYFLESHTNPDVFILVQSAEKFKSHIDTFVYMLEFYLQITRTALEKPNDEWEYLSIVLSSSMTVNEFRIKLEAMEKIYSELIELTNLSLIDYPLKIVKIESGSLFAKVMGNKKVIGLMVNFISSSIAYLYRNYTSEGQLTELPRKYKAIEEAINFSKSMEKAGYNTEGIDEQIQKSAVEVSKQLTELISNESEIVMNDEIYLGTEQDKKLIENKKPKALKSPEN